MNPIRLILLAERTTYRTDPPGTGEPEWSWTDSSGALAMGGASDLEVAALEYRFRRAGRCRHVLYGALMVEAVKAEKRHRWPERIDGRRYLEPMVQLALDVEANPEIDGVKPLVLPIDNGYRRLPGWWCLRLPWVSERAWDRTVSRIYSVVRQPLDMWVGEAVRWARRGLDDDHESTT